MKVKIYKCKLYGLKLCKCILVCYFQEQFYLRLHQYRTVFNRSLKFGGIIKIKKIKKLLWIIFGSCPTVPVLNLCKMQPNLGADKFYNTASGSPPAGHNLDGKLLVPCSKLLVPSTKYWSPPSNYWSTEENSWSPATKTGPLQHTPRPLKKETGPGQQTTGPSQETTGPLQQTTSASSKLVVPFNKLLVPSNKLLIPSRKLLVHYNKNKLLAV